MKRPDDQHTGEDAGTVGGGDPGKAIIDPFRLDLSDLCDTRTRLFIVFISNQAGPSTI